MTKATLKQYQAIESEMKDIEELMTRLRARLESPGMAVISATPYGRKSIKDKVAAMVARLEALMERYGEKWDALIDLQDEIEAAIEGLDPVERRLMRLKYIDGLSWEQVCVEMSYGWDSVHRIHRQILELLAPEKNVVHNRTL